MTFAGWVLVAALVVFTVAAILGKTGINTPRRPDTRPRTDLGVGVSRKVGPVWLSLWRRRR